MRRFLQGASGSSSRATKREAVTFAEDGWARASTRTGFQFSPVPEAEGEAEAEVEVEEERGHPTAVETDYADGEFVEQETYDEVPEYSEYYAGEGEKGAEEAAAETEGYAYEAEPELEVEEYAEGYGEEQEAAEVEEPEEYQGAVEYAEGEDEEQDYGVELQATDDEALEQEEVQQEETEEAQQEETEDSLVPYTLSQIARRVQVRHVEGKGRCLYSREALAPGEIIFVEKPVLVAVPSLNNELWELLTELNKESAFELPPIWHLAALCSMTMLGEEGFNICMDKWVPETEVEPSDDVLRICSYLEGDLDPAVYERMLLVWRYNSFGHHTESQGLVLYNRISMMAHSCKATGCWHYGQDDAFVLRARVLLQRGDEITISYIGDEELFKSTNLRREKVQGWLFTCQCVRCSNPLDPARGFRCPTCGTGTMFFKTDDDVTTSCPCTVCGTVPTEDTINQYIIFETAYADRLAETNKSDMADAEMVYEQATRVFTQHWILFQLDTVLFEGYRAAGDYESAYVHQAHRVQFVTQVLPAASYSLAWIYEEMGDVLWSRIQAKGKPYADSRLRIAGRHFEDAYNLLYIMCGPDHEYTAAAAAKRNKIDELATAI